jgi:hypothetical protein
MIAMMIVQTIAMNDYSGRITGDSRRIADGSTGLRSVVTYRSTIMGKLNAIK